MIYIRVKKISNQIFAISKRYVLPSEDEYVVIEPKLEMKDIKDFDDWIINENQRMVRR